MKTHKAILNFMACVFVAALSFTASCGGGGNEDVSPLSAPTGVEAFSGDSLVLISWKGVSDAVVYNIYFATSPGVTKLTGTLIPSIPTTSYTHSGLTNGTTYYYVVTAENSAEESVESSEVNATPSGTAP